MLGPLRDKVKGESHFDSSAAVGTSKLLGVGGAGLETSSCTTAEGSSSSARERDVVPVTEKTVQAVSPSQLNGG